MSQDNIEPYLTGSKLWGDDFSAEQISEWYEDEREAYAGLGAADHARYVYSYHALNQRYGYRWLPAGDFEHVLGMGSAYGDEFAPIASRIRRLTIIEPSSAFKSRVVHGVPATFVPPDPTGVLPIPDGSLDLITCFGVLHHIPNVSFVIREFHRCLRPGGHVLIREPVVSMGDWRALRRNLTKRERGIPLAAFRAAIRGAGFSIQLERLCGFPLVPLALKALGVKQAYNHASVATLDDLFSRAFAWNLNYHPRTFLHKLRPTSAAFVLTR